MTALIDDKRMTSVGIELSHDEANVVRTKIGLEPRLPIAEHFVSPQGEGFWCGTLMQFIRFAGCTVGKPYQAAEREALGLHVYQERCTAWNGTSFPCDTNYKMAERLTASEIVALVPANVTHVCLTGGEPLMHDLNLLITLLNAAGKYVHLETSGTIDFTEMPWWSLDKIWVAVSPKANYLDICLDCAAELKILIADDFDEATFVATFKRWFAVGRVYIQPINDEFTLDMRNVKRCLELQQKYPAILISVQLHKVLNVR